VADPRFKSAQEGFKINPKNFDWFMAGIDYDKLRKIIADEPEQIDTRVKLENTFAAVRENQADEELQGLNNFEAGFDALNLGANQPLFEFGSEIRQRPDDEGVFERTILRDGQVAPLQEFQANFNMFE
jgi:hypothetical protein